MRDLVRGVVRSVRRGVQRLDRLGVSDIVIAGLPSYEVISNLFDIAETDEVTERAIRRLDRVFERLASRLDRRLDADVTFAAATSESMFAALVGDGNGDGGEALCLYGECDEESDDISFVDEDNGNGGPIGDDGGDSPSPVPLPAGSLLLLSGLAGFGVWTRRRKSQA